MSAGVPLRIHSESIFIIFNIFSLFQPQPTQLFSQSQQPQQQQTAAPPPPPTTAGGSQAPAAEPAGWAYHPVQSPGVARPAPTPATGPLTFDTAYNFPGGGGGGGGLPPVSMQEFHPHFALQVPLFAKFTTLHRIYSR
jgi:hypothetical protein